MQSFIHLFVSQLIYHSSLGDIAPAVVVAVVDIVVADVVVYSTGPPDSCVVGSPEGSLFRCVLGLCDSDSAGCTIGL